MNGEPADLYRRFVRPLLFHLDPETAHKLAIGTLRFLSSIPAALRAFERFQPEPEPTTIFGLTFRNRIGLAAGLDKNGVALPAWAALGFGFLEIGTVTAKPQPGNPKPRVFRYPDHEALVNRLGFNNDGADIVGQRLHKLREGGRWPSIPVGINIGKSKVTEVEQAAADYLHSFQRVVDVADYVVLNVSSPNTPGLRSLQDREFLARLLGTINDENAHRPKPVPILLKIAPDLAESDIDQIVATCESERVAGIVATNTTVDHSALNSRSDQSGGLSGAPLRNRSTEIIRLIRARSQLPIIGVGGIFDAESAREKFNAGAQLLQVYTGYVYCGPSLLREIGRL
jgi:dihydroorotate dehydrogenase